jgi:hypothetical protein
MRKEYTIKELQTIFGCSRTAIVKKIKTAGDNTDIRRYKDRYEVGVKDGQMVILFEDWELEEEKRLSKGMGLVSNNGNNTPSNEDIIDVEPNVTEIKQDTLYNFTERYIDKFTTLQETMYNELRERDKQILLLTTSEKSKQDEYLKTVAENKTLKLRNTTLKVILGVVVTVLVCVITYCITVTTTVQNVPSNDTSNVTTSEQVTVQPEAQPKKMPARK